MYDNIIFIPYRDREEHLKYIMKHYIPLIRDNLPNTKIVILEQMEGKMFNRGKLLNVGFNEFRNRTRFFMTNDIDTIPNKYQVKKNYSEESHKIYGIYCGHCKSLGGILKIEHDTLFSINGFPNNIWGWGIEDRALFHRAKIRGFEIKHYYNKASAKQHEDYTILKHKKTMEVYSNKKLELSEMWKDNYINNLCKKDKEKLVTYSGVNNIEYNIVSKKSINDFVDIYKIEL